MTLEERLIKDEGFRLQAYDDATGKPLRRGMVIRGNVTIGYGRNLMGRGITQEEAVYLFHNDIALLLTQLATALPWYLKLSPVRQQVIQNLCFNMGIDGLLKCGPTLAIIRAGDYARAADRMTTWKMYRDAPARAKRLVAMMRDDREGA